MNRGLTLLAGMACWSSLVAAGWAAESTPPAATPNVQTPAEAVPVATLRAQMHRTLADLIEAQAATPPDQAKIDQLTQQLQQVRAKLLAQRPAANAAWGGPGRGYGRGPGWGYGMGRGPGMGPGYGMGRGLGPGMGRGFVDRDGNGICDYFEARQAPPAK